MLHVVSVHFSSPRWIEIQARHLRRHIPVPYMTWTSLEGIDPSWGEHFDRVFEQRGRHPGKLNHLAMEIAHEFPAEDLLMFLDGDAFPVADPMPLIEQSLSRAPLLAVRRAENVDQPQPHPCFCVTTIGAWRELPGDWSGGPTWPGARGIRVTDVGGHLLRTMELKGLPWVQVLRSNKVDLDPLHFAVYGDVVYHHGAGFRAGDLSGVHSDNGPPRVQIPGAGPLNRLINRRRWVRWERAMERHHLEQSEQVYRRIAAGGDEWLRELI
ncbi:MAG TPA: hypothetical protein VGD00_05590 [Solirubrobacteraceae bacterium]